MSSSVLPAIFDAVPSLKPYFHPRHQPFEPKYNLEDLVQDVKSHLGDSHGIAPSDIDTEYLMSRVWKYTSEPNDWAPFFCNDASKNYTRNAIENINHKANILLLTWNPGKGSPIHDHANAHCIMKVLAGELQETVYHTPDTDSDSGPLEIKSDTTHKVNDVTYISDEIGLHRVHNPSSTQLAVSLHIYTPPNAADYGYNIYNEATGKPSFVSQTSSVPHQ